MAYSRKRILSQLGLIQQVLPKVVAVRTEVIHNMVKMTAYDGLILTLSNGKASRVNIGHWKAEPDRPMKQIMRAFQLEEAAATQLLQAGRALFHENPFGAWCVRATKDRNPVILSAYDEAEAFCRSDYAMVIVDRLAELLPSVARVVSDGTDLSMKNGGRVRRRIWLRFMDVKDREMAAIDAALLPVHAKDAVIGREHEFLDTNLQRMAYWGEQLRVDPVDVSGDEKEVEVLASGEVCSLLYVASTILGVNELRLHRG